MTTHPTSETGKETGIIYEQKTQEMATTLPMGLTVHHKAQNHRDSMSFTSDRKIPCWMSFNIHLVDIILQNELFVINAWLVVFFKDIHNDFSALFDENALGTLQQQGYMDYDALNVSIRKRLPLKQSFLLNSADMDIKRGRLELEDKDENIWKLYFRFNASCAEHMELAKFPFDSQFLNLKIVYRIQDFYFLSTCPDWILKDMKHKVFSTHKPIKLTVKDSIKSQWRISTPWIDMRSDRGEGYNFHFSVIRLRVSRKPEFYLLNGILPLFLVIVCSFAQFVMPVEDYVNDKLSYIITLLLTMAAFQYALSTDLPKTSESTMIDLYILWGYGILSAFTLEIVLVYKIHSSGDEDAALLFDYVTVSIFALSWIYRTAKFLREYMKSRRHEVDWHEISDDEMKGWSADMHGGSTYMGVAEGDFLSTDANTVCS
eukprot:233198_1